MDLRVKVDTEARAPSLVIGPATAATVTLYRTPGDNPLMV